MRRTLLLCFLASTAYAYYDQQQQVVDPQIDYHQSSSQLLETERHDPNVETSSYVITRGPYRYVVQRRVYVQPTSGNDQQLQANTHLFAGNSDDTRDDDAYRPKPVVHRFFGGLEREGRDGDQTPQRQVPILRLSAGKFKDSSSESKESKEEKKKEKIEDKSKNGSPESLEDESKEKKYTKTPPKAGKKKSKLDKSKVDKKKDGVDKKPTTTSSQQQQDTDDYTLINQQNIETPKFTNINQETGKFDYDTQAQINTNTEYNDQMSQQVNSNPMQVDFPSINIDDPPQRPLNYAAVHQITNPPTFTIAQPYPQPIPPRPLYPYSSYVSNSQIQDQIPQQPQPGYIYGGGFRGGVPPYTDYYSQQSQVDANAHTSPYTPQNTPNQESSQLYSSNGQRPDVFPDQGQESSHVLIGSHPKLTLTAGSQTSAVKPTPVAPGIYWKTFGEKIQESFNKSKAATADSGTGASASPSPIPPGYWVTFGQQIAKAFNDAKIKLNAATISAKSTVPPASADGSVITNPTEGTPEVDETFWHDFGQQLDAALNPYPTPPATSTPTQYPINYGIQQVEPDVFDQQVHNYDLDQQTNDQFNIEQSSVDVLHGNGIQQPPLHLQSTGVGTVPLAPPAPGIYWKNYGDKIKEAFMPIGPVYVSPSDNTPVAPNPGAYWMNYGNQIGKTFTDAKFKVISATDTKPTAIPIGSTTPGPVIDDAFWAEFGKKLHDMVQPIDTASTVTPFVQDLNQQVSNVDFPTDISPTEFVTKPEYFNQESVTDLPISHNIAFQSNLKLSADLEAPIAATTTPSAIGTYWKTFGEKIKESFNKTKTETTTNEANVIVDEPVTVPTSTPIPVTFWSSFGKRVAKAFTDAKSKLVTATGKAKALLTPSTVPTTEGTPQVEIDNAFWDGFSKQLDEAIQAKNEAKAAVNSTTEVPVESHVLAVAEEEPLVVGVEDEFGVQQPTWDNSDQVTQNLEQQNVETFDQQQTQKLEQQVPQNVENFDQQHTQNLEQQNVETYGQQQAFNDDDMQQQSSHDLLGHQQLFLSGAADVDAPLSGPGLYWKNYGQEIGGKFVDFKAKIADAKAKAVTDGSGA